MWNKQSFNTSIKVIILTLCGCFLQAQSQRDVHSKPVWDCASLENSLPKKYELKIYRRRGDQRFQFVFVQIKPKRIMMADIAEEMEKVEGDGLPTTTRPSKMLFSFSIDKSKKIKNGYTGSLVLDQTYDLRNPFKFPVENPLLLKCTPIK